MAMNQQTQSLRVTHLGCHLFLGLLSAGAACRSLSDVFREVFGPEAGVHRGGVVVRIGEVSRQ